MTEKHSLTPVEFELMEILWRIEKGTVRDVLAELSDDRKLAYTSVSTILRILQQKNILKAEKNGKHHIYMPTLSKQNFASYSVKKMVNQIFSGNAMQLVAYLMDKNDLSNEDIAAIQHIINTKKKEMTS